jgi:hypothetical protein
MLYTNKLPWKYTHIVHYVIYIIPGMNIITEGNTLSHYLYPALCMHSCTHTSEMRASITLKGIVRPFGFGGVTILYSVERLLL